MNKYSAVKVLVVDEQPLIVEQLSDFLESSGYPCVPCYSSREAIEQFRNDSAIGIVLCDLDMPELNGLELMEAMKIIAGKKRMFEAIMLTGSTEKQDVIDALRAGVADYYQKPMNLSEVLQGVKRQELALQDRQDSFEQLVHLNEKLQFLSASIDELYQDLDKTRRPYLPASVTELTSADTARHTQNLMAPLSPRQQDVARLVATGQTNYQIGCELGITENTVKLYVSQILRLTQMQNRTQLALALSPEAGKTRRVATAH